MNLLLARRRYDGNARSARWRLKEFFKSLGFSSIASALHRVAPMRRDGSNAIPSCFTFVVNGIALWGNKNARGIKRA